MTLTENSSGQNLDSFWLINRFINAPPSVYDGAVSPEHDQIARLARQAVKFKLDDTVTQVLAEASTRYPNSIERNLDCLSVNHDSIWIEWREALRSRENATLEGNIQPEWSGLLINRHPDNMDIVSAIAVWTTHTSARATHSPAIMSLSLTDLHNLSVGARRFYGRGVIESKARIMDHVFARTPEGFRDEIAILSGEDKIREFDEAAKRNVTAEAIFMLASLLFLESNASLVSHVPDEGDVYYTVGLNLSRSLRGWHRLLNRRAFYRYGAQTSPKLGFAARSLLA